MDKFNKKINEVSELLTFLNDEKNKEIIDNYKKALEVENKINNLFTNKKEDKGFDVAKYLSEQNDAPTDTPNKKIDDELTKKVLEKFKLD